MTLKQRIDVLAEQLDHQTVCVSYKIKVKRNIAYAVFANGFDLLEFNVLYPRYFEGCCRCCFNGYENAFELGRLH